MGDECCAVFWDGAKAISLFPGGEMKTFHAKQKKKKKGRAGNFFRIFFSLFSFFFFFDIDVSCVTIYKSMRKQAVARAARALGDGAEHRPAFSTH